MTPRTRPWVGALAFDAAAVLLFAAAGRQSHEGGSGIREILTVSAPFLVGLAVAWMVVPGARREPLTVRTALGVWAGTVIVGLFLRRTAWDRDTAVSFIVVTTLVLGALILGWRALWTVGERRRTIRS